MLMGKQRLLSRLWWLNGFQPRSLQARQLLAASFQFSCFLALAGYALDAAFADTADSRIYVSG